MTRPGVYLSSSFQKTKAIDEVFHALSETDVRFVELSGGSEYTPDPLPRLKEAQQKDGYIFSVHNYFPPPAQSFILNIASSDDEERRRSLGFAKNSMRLAGALGLDLYTIHAGYRSRLVPKGYADYFEDISPTDAREGAVERCFASVRELCGFGRSLGIRVGVENLFPINAKKNYSIMCVPDEWDEMFRALGDLDNLGMLFDFGHLNVTCHYLGLDREAAIQHAFGKYGNRIFEVHVSQNEGDFDSHDVFTRDSWMIPILKRLPLQDKVVTLETRGHALADVLSGYQLLQEVVYGG
ncbi:MAG: sugar phosphate isomerase/epimerase [Elusimicrobia bacterium]|nr:sugar phosphate isomerase/epimerase [Elusimicrobiota bacterium]